jgi:putative oxidoreductase
MPFRPLQGQVERVYAVLRIVAGAMFAFHGVQKIFGVLTDHQPPAGSQLWMGGIIELLCGIVIAIGLQVGWAAFLASGTMAVAYIQFHWKLQFGKEFLPAVNRGELAALYCFLFLYMAAKGSGGWSVDEMMHRRR